jgi:hypothetical protein
MFCLRTGVYHGLWRGAARLAPPSPAVCGCGGIAETASRQGRRAPSVYYVSSRVVWQDKRRAGVPQAVITVSELRSEPHLRSPDLTRAAPSVTAVVGSMVVGAGLIVAVLVADFILGAFLRGVSGSVLTRTAVEEAVVIVGVLLGAFLTHE